MHNPDGSAFLCMCEAKILRAVRMRPAMNAINTQNVSNYVMHTIVESKRSEYCLRGLITLFSKTLGYGFGLFNFRLAAQQAISIGFAIPISHVF